MGRTGSKSLLLWMKQPQRHCGDGRVRPRPGRPRASRASSTTSARSAVSSSARARRMPSRSIASPPSRRPAVSTSVSSRPSRRMVSRSTSRVVPGTSVTMARSLPASAFSSELLPAFGGPTITACRPSRSLRPRSASASSCVRFACACCKSFPHRCAAQRVQGFVGEIDRRFHMHAQRRQAVGECIDASREHALQRASRRARRARVGSGDQVGDGLGLGQVEAIVEEGALAEFARPRRPRAQRAGACDQLLQHHRAAVRLQFDHVFAGEAVAVRGTTARCRRRSFRRRHAVKRTWCACRGRRRRPQMLSAIASERGPDSRTMPTPPAPGAVAMAAMVSVFDGADTEVDVFMRRKSCISKKKTRLAAGSSIRRMRRFYLLTIALAAWPCPPAQPAACPGSCPATIAAAGPGCRW